MLVHSVVVLPFLLSIFYGQGKFPYQKTSPLTTKRSTCVNCEDTTPLFHEGLKNYPWSHPRVINPNRVRGGVGSFFTVPDIINSSDI